MTRNELDRIEALIIDLVATYNALTIDGWHGETPETARIRAKLNGIADVLAILGYTIRYTDDKTPYIEKL